MRPSVRTLLALSAAAAVVVPLLPAAAAAPAAAPRVELPGPAGAVAALLAGRGEAGLVARERALHDVLTGRAGLRAWSSAASSSAAPAPLPQEQGFLGAVADLDGDRRPELLDVTAEGTAVRSGRTGAVLGRRTDVLLEVPGTGRVRLLAVDSRFEEAPGGYTVTDVLRGLDARLRPVWEHQATGTVRFVQPEQVEQAHAATLDRLPLLLGLDRTAVLGTLSGGASPLGLAGTLQVDALDLQTGALSRLATVTGAGAALPSALPVGPLGGATTCLATVAPAGPGSVVGLGCDGAQAWSRPVDLPAPFVDLAGRFPGDAVPDLLVTDPAFFEEEGAGSRVLSGVDGAELATSALSGVMPMGVDVSGDGRPDVQRVVFEEGLGLEALTLEGRRLYRREARLSGSGSAGLAVFELTGDGVPDGLLTAQAEGGPLLTAVVEGRKGGVTLRRDVDGLSLRSVSGRGADLLVRAADRGRLRVTALAPVGGRVLRTSVVPAARGTAGAVGAGAVTGVHLDGDGRRDLVVVSRRGTTRLVTALRADGRTLWQQRERAQPLAPSGEGVVVVG